MVKSLELLQGKVSILKSYSITKTILYQNLRSLRINKLLTTGYHQLISDNSLFLFLGMNFSLNFSQY